jgi:hypothetical protein
MSVGEAALVGLRGARRLFKEHSLDFGCPAGRPLALFIHAQEL